MIAVGDLVSVRSAVNKFLIPARKINSPLYGVVFEENETVYTKEKVYFIKVLGFQPDYVVGPLYEEELEKIL